MTGGAAGGAVPRVTACRGCCCGTARKHPGVDHDRLLDRLVDEVGDRGLVRTTDCLGPCAESNVVIVTPSPDARRRGARPVWVRAVLDEVTVRGIGEWVRDGGPGAAEIPLELAGRVFPRPGG
ncbi:hypothetical protein EV383_4691 [Pseudonocardia sediminis]|uniref:(2Fe-2S) ferredoxin n=1 Tax=Pseudonocardia sediminis TaxID=1397368 RepID=A0A4Q7V0Y2_PSEST|nr:hypothetical protein EV383_4691 [Pseudonocardia sediminis]